MIAFRIEELVKFDDAGPEMQTLAESGHARTVLICLKAGQRLKDHRPPSEVHVHVVRGLIRVVQGPRTLSAGPGDLVIVPAGGQHRLEAAEEAVILATISPHPMGEDYPRDRRDVVVPQASHETG